MKKLVIFALLILSQKSFAGPFTLPTVDPTQVDGIFRTMAADNVYRSVQGAGTFGKIFGLAAGLTVQQGSTAPMGSLLGSGTPYVYSGNLDFTLQLPSGFAVEIGFLPNLNMSSTSLTRYGGALKWTMSENLLSWSPIAIALRGIYTRTDLSYSQPLGAGSVNVGYGSTISGATLAFSKSLVVIEPYISYGIISHTSTLSGTGTANLFTIPITNSTGSGSSGFFQAGIEFKLMLINIGVEYGSLFGTDTGAVRAGFKF